MSNRRSHFVHRLQTLLSALAGVSGSRRLLALAAVLALLAPMLLPTTAQAQTAPTITSVDFTSDPNDDDRAGDDDTYAIGDTIEVTLTFSEAVTVGGSVSSRPQLDVDVGGQTRVAQYEAGGGTDKLAFRFDVHVGDEDTDGIAVKENTLTPGSGVTIKGGSGTDAVLEHAAENGGSAHKVDGIRPVFVSAETNVGGTKISARFSEDLASADRIYMIVRPGGLAPQAVETMGTMVIVTPRDAIRHDQTVTISFDVSSVRDGSGNTNEASTDNAVVNNVPGPAAVAFTSDAGADNTYAIGDPIEATLTFAEAVTVTGTPRIALQVGDGTRTADYASGSGSVDLVFSYTVAVGDEDSDGVAVEAGAVALNGGTIMAGATAATLTHQAEAANPAHTVDGVRPTLESATVEHMGVLVQMNFSEDLQAGNPPPASALALTADGSPVAIGMVGLGLLDNEFVLDGLDPTILMGQTVVVTYTDPTAGDDAEALQDAAGNDVASFTTGSDGVPAVVNNSTVAAPGAPQNVVAEAFTGRVTLDWDAPASDGGSPITHYEYRLQRDTGSFGDWELADHRDFRHVLGADGTSLVFRGIHIRSDETFTYEVRAVSANGPGAAQASNAIHTAPQASMRVEAADVRVSEGAGTVTINAVLEIPDGWGPYDQDLNNTFTSDQGTALVGEDYVSVAVVFTFAPQDFVEGADGRWSATAGTEVTILDDQLDENDESFTLRLQRGTAVPHWLPNPSSNFRTTITIEDDDELMWSVTAAPAAIEEDGGVSTVTVRTNDVEFPADQTITLTLGTETTAATPGTDFTIANSAGAALSSPYTLTLPMGEVEVAATITASADTVDDENETVTITALLGAEQIGETATVTIATTPPNAVPVFPPGSPVREVAENSPAGTDVGDPVTATDDDNDTLTYSLVDDSSFDIVSTSGQIRTKAGVTYDYETRSVYGVAVTADDGNGGTNNIAVTINLLDVDEVAPALESATVEPDGATIDLVFDEPYEQDAAFGLLSTAFSVTADGSTVTIGSLDVLPDADLEYRTVGLTELSPAITYGQVVTVSYTDATAGDDATGVLQDEAGNDVASFTTGSGGVPEVVNNVPNAAPEFGTSSATREVAENSPPARTSVTRSPPPTTTTTP